MSKRDGSCQSRQRSGEQERQWWKPSKRNEPPSCPSPSKLSASWDLSASPERQFHWLAVCAARTRSLPLSSTRSTPSNERCPMHSQQCCKSDPASHQGIFYRVHIHT